MAVEEEEQEQASCAAIPVDLRTELQDMDLINANWLARTRADRVSGGGIVQSFRMVLMCESIWAMLHLLFDQQRNLLWEHIL